MRHVMLLALVSFAALADHRGRFERFCSRTADGRTNRGFPCEDPLPFFSAFTSSGAGTFGACSTTPPTDSKGNAISSTRASAATCSKVGMSTTGIQPGDLVTLSTNQPRVEPDADGVLAVRVEGSATNVATRSAEPANAIWLKENSGAAAPYLDGGVALAPDGTTTAANVYYPATTAAQFSGTRQTVGLASMQATGSIYLRALISGTADVCFSLMAGGYGCSPCAFVAGSTSRCSVTGVGTVNPFFYIGNMTSVNGGTVRAVSDVFWWGAHFQSGPLATSYIPTTSAAVTRNADVVSFATTLSGSTFSAATSMTTPSALVANSTAFQVYVDANNSVTAYVDGSAKLVCNFRIGGMDNTVTSVASVVASASNRVACQYGAAGRSACVGGACTTTAGTLTMPTGAATFYAGTRSATGNESNSLHSRLCYDPSDAGCV